MSRRDFSAVAMEITHVVQGPAESETVDINYLAEEAANLRAIMKPLGQPVEEPSEVEAIFAAYRFEILPEAAARQQGLHVATDHLVHAK